MYYSSSLSTYAHDYESRFSQVLYAADHQFGPLDSSVKLKSLLHLYLKNGRDIIQIQDSNLVT